MTVDLGGIDRLAVAIGLVDADGGLVADWFSRPGDYLASVLADDDRRAALLEFADEVLGGTTATTDAAGRRWVPVADVDSGAFTVAAVIEELADRIHVGAGLRVDHTSQSGVGVAAEVVVPLFATARGDPPDAVDPILLGTAAGAIDLDLTVELPGGEVAGGVGLDSASLGATVPTSAAGEPSFRLALVGLTLPGATAPRDIVVDAAGLDELDDAVLDLVLGLARSAAADTAVAGPFTGLASMLGLGDDAVPDFPIDDLRARGAGALADWFAEAMSSAAARTDWLGGLATLIGGTVAGDAVELTVLGADVRLGVTVAPGTAALPTITPSVSISAAGATGVELSLAADPVVLDLGTGAAVALPRLAATVRIAAPAGPLLTGASAGGLTIGVGSLEAGLALDGARRPKLVLTAFDADVGATHFDVLDLSSPEALAAAAEDVVGDAAALLLQQIGPAGDAVAVLIGLVPPSGAGPAPPALDVAAFLADPLAAVGEYWRVLVASHADVVPDVLAVLRDAIAAEPVRGVEVEGTGTENDPWRVPLAAGIDVIAWHVAETLTVALDVRAGAGDVLGSNVLATLGATAVVVELDLGARGAAFLPAADGRLELSHPDGGALVLGTGAVGASARSVGVSLRWRAGEGVSGGPSVVDARVILQGTALALPALTRGPDGQLTLDDAGWAAVEGLLGAAAELAGDAIGADWPVEAATLLGWRPDAGAGPRLELAALLADPPGALGLFARELFTVADDASVVMQLLELLATLLAGAFDRRPGAGRPEMPWRLPLGGADAALIASFAPAGPENPPTLVSGALRVWQPGDPGLDPDTLFGELTVDAALDDELSDLLAGRGDVAAGLTELLERWAATDGLVALPDGVLPAAVTGHRVDDLAHGAPLGPLDVEGVLGGTAPDTVVYVAVDAPGCPAVLTGGPLDGLADERSLDLTAPGPPEVAPVPVAAPGAWIVRLGGRADCKLPEGDADGVEGQAARLRRTLAPLAAAGAAVIAHGGAGHAALRAAAELPGLAALVTVGTPWSPVSVDVLDRTPATDTLRLLAALLPPADDEEPDDADLARARALIGDLLALDALGDPLAELRAVGALDPPAGVPVHAVVGSMSTPALLRAVTAASAASLAARAQARAAAGAAPPASTRLGLGMPLIPSIPRGGLVAAATADFDLLGLSPDPAAPPAGPSLAVRFDLSSASGWLVGGPDPGRAPGISRPLALRRLTTTVRVPLLGAEGARTTIVLHDATVFGVARSRWVVEVGPDAPDGATALLPEVRALLGAVAGRLGTPDPGLDALRDALTALGLLDPSGGADAGTLEQLLFDPVATFAVGLDDASRRGALAAALRSLAGDARAAAGDAIRFLAGGVAADVDLATRAVTITAAGQGAVPWAATAAVVAGAVAGTARFGADLPEPGTTDPLAGPAVAVLIAGPPLDVRLRVRHPGRVDDVALWPTPDPGAIADALADAAPAALLHVLLETLRATLSASVPAAGAAVDAVLAALGLLGTAPDEDSPRPLRLPVTLLRDPAAWLGTLPGGLIAAAPSLVDALRALLSAGGADGALDVTDGVTVRATASDGRLTLAVDVDGTSFPPPATGLTLVVAGSAGVTVAVGASVLPVVQLGLTVPTVGAVRLGVVAGAGATPAVTLVLAPDGGAEIPLLPAGPGLGGAAAAAGAVAVRALPPLLDALAARDPAGTADEPLEIAGRLVARLGDALGLRVGPTGGRQFDGDALAAFGVDPASALATHAATLATTGLNLLQEAVGPILGGTAGRSVTVSAGALVVALGDLAVRWLPGTTRVEVTVTATGVPGVETVTGAATLDATGLLGLDIAVGPANLAAGPVVLRPYARTRTGAALPGGTSVEVGVGSGTDILAARWLVAGGDFALLALTGTAESTAPADVAAAVLAVVTELAGSVVLAIEAVRQALGRPLLGTTAQALLTGVLLEAAAEPRILPGVLDPSTVRRRLATLLDNLAAAPGASVTIDDALTLAPHKATAGGADIYGLTLSLSKPYTLVGDGITVTLEDDASWITPPAGSVPEGLTVTALSVAANGTVRFRPGLIVGGIGMRFGQSGGPLLDAGITLDSLAVLVFADIQVTGGTASLAGGARLELAGLAVPMAGASGGDNAVAQGLLTSGGDSSGEEPPQPAFSPAVAVQRHPGGPTLVTLSAGPGTGPWWLVVQRAFGPVYIEQVGFAVTMEQDRIGSFGLLIDGSVSLLGLSAAVDDLSLTYLVSSGKSALDPEAWRADLAGFAVTSDVAGITLAGGLRRFPVDQGGVEYLGLLLARFGVYGITVYGGYGLVGPSDDQFDALFLFGAVNGPIGGPPAFFVTGIGGGFGINRALVYPDDLSDFGTYPFIKALDPAARPGDPMAELESVRGFFPAERGTFWFAAGLSFTSFALVDGVAVVAVQIGEGFELTLLGLARMALPRPQAALVSVELGLIARFSSTEGELLVQAQLTDNSWLLYPSVRLTGGFAFATWFTGPNRGQFVLTLGGYHPSFRREGYPQVPRLGIDWQVTPSIGITGESYFALTSEAVMAGARIEAHADFGPAWASVVVGGDGIVFFDPFWLSVTVYASISAGVTVDVWIGEITISVSLSARVTLEGPPFHGKASFSVGPVDLTVEFGDRPTQPLEIGWDEFAAKYLEEAAPGEAHVLACVTGRGAVPPAGSSATGGDQSPDGSDARPFRVMPEFELTVTSTAPVRELVVGTATTDLPTVPEVSAAPMRAPAKPKVTLRLRGPDGATTNEIGRLRFDPQQLGAFAIGTWGPAQSQDDAKVPSGAVLAGVDRVVLTGEATIADPTTGTAPAIKYRQVETGAQRRPLPFVVEYTAARRERLERGADLLAGLIPAVGAAGTIPVAADLLATRAERGAADVAAWTGARTAAPLLGSLAEGLGGPIRLTEVEQTIPPAPAGLADPRPPVVAAVLSAPAGAVPQARDASRGAGTTVSRELRAELGGKFPVAVTSPPRLDAIDRGLDAATPARLLRPAVPAVDTQQTVVAAGSPPVTRTGRTGAEAVGGRGADPEATERLTGLRRALLRDGAELTDGDVAVLRLPDHARDVDPEKRPVLAVVGGRLRVVVVLPGSRVAADTVLDAGGRLEIAPGARSVVCVTGVPAAGARIDGWMAHTPVAYTGDETWIGAGVTVRSAGRVPGRGLAYAGSGWIAPEELVAGRTAVVTTFADRVTVVAVAVEGGHATDDDVALGLAGASRVSGPDGRPLAPVVVADGPRTVSIYAVEPARKGPISVTVSTAADRRLAGVAGTAGIDPDGFGAAVAARGLPDLVPPAAADGLGRHRIAWKEP